MTGIHGQRRIDPCQGVIALTTPDKIRVFRSGNYIDIATAKLRPGEFRDIVYAVTVCIGAAINDIIRKLNC